MNTVSLKEVPVCIVAYPVSDENININFNVCTNKSKVGLEDISG